MNAWKQTTEPLGGQFPSANPNPCAAPGADCSPLAACDLAAGLLEAIEAGEHRSWSSDALQDLVQAQRLLGRAEDALRRADEEEPDSAPPLADLTGPEARARLALLLEDAPGLPDLCANTADELEDLSPDPDMDPDPVPPSLEDLTARMNAGLRALALLLAASAEILQVARAAGEGGRS